MKKPLQGKISINRYTGGLRSSGITIRIEDGISGTECIEIELTVEAFGNAITGSSDQPCEFELRTEQVGKTYEHKTIVIPFDPKNFKKRQQEAQKALEPYEVDGWIGRVDDLLNHHRLGEGGYKVHFGRFVEIPA